MTEEVPIPPAPPAASPLTGGERALLSIALYTTVGAVLGHYVGRWGENVSHAGKGPSVLVGRVLGGVGLGGLAAYVTLSGVADKYLIQRTAASRDAMLPPILGTVAVPALLMDAASAEYQGPAVVVGPGKKL